MLWARITAGPKHFKVTGCYPWTPRTRICFPCAFETKSLKVYSAKPSFFSFQLIHKAKQTKKIPVATINKVVPISLFSYKYISDKQKHHKESKPCTIQE